MPCFLLILSKKTNSRFRFFIEPVADKFQIIVLAESIAIFQNNLFGCFLIAAHEVLDFTVEATRDNNQAFINLGKLLKEISLSNEFGSNMLNQIAGVFMTCPRRMINAYYLYRFFIHCQYATSNIIPITCPMDICWQTLKNIQ